MQLDWPTSESERQAGATQLPTMQSSPSSRLPGSASSYSRSKTGSSTGSRPPSLGLSRRDTSSSTSTSTRRISLLGTAASSLRSSFSSRPSSRTTNELSPHKILTRRGSMMKAFRNSMSLIPFEEEECSSCKGMLETIDVRLLWDDDEQERRETFRYCSKCDRCPDKLDSFVNLVFKLPPAAVAEIGGVYSQGETEFEGHIKTWGDVITDQTLDLRVPRTVCLDVKGKVSYPDYGAKADDYHLTFNLAGAKCKFRGKRIDVLEVTCGSEAYQQVLRKGDQIFALILNIGDGLLDPLDNIGEMLTVATDPVSAEELRSLDDMVIKQFPHRRFTMPIKADASGALPRGTQSRWKENELGGRLRRAHYITLFLKSRRSSRADSLLNHSRKLELPMDEESRGRLNPVGLVHASRGDHEAGDLGVEIDGKFDTTL